MGIFLERILEIHSSATHRSDSIVDLKKEISSVQQQDDLFLFQKCVE